MEATFIARFVKGILATSLGTVITLMFGFINIGIAVRCISKVDFGVFLLIQTIVFSVVIVGDLGLNVSATKFLADSDIVDKKEVVGTVIVLRGAILVAAILVTIFCKSGISYLFKFEGVTELYYYIPVLIVMESYNGMFSSILQGIQQYRQMAFAQVLASVTNACFIIITVVLLHLGIKGLIVSRLMALLTAMLYQQRVARTSIRLSFNTVMAKKIMNFGVFLGVNNILSFIFSRIDTLIIGAVMNPIGVALYGTAAKIPDASRQLFESFRSVFFPNMAELFSQQKKEEAEAILNNSLRLVSFLSLLLSLIIIIFLNDVVKILFSKKYIECAPVLSLLMVAMCIGLIGNVLGTSLVAAGYSKLPALINVVDATVCVIANLALIPPFGITGAAYAAILARVATTPVNVYFLRKNGINVSILQFVRPIAVFGGCSVLLAVYDGYIYKILILLLYILLSTCFLIITRDDVLSVKRVFLILPQSANTK